MNTFTLTPLGKPMHYLSALLSCIGFVLVALFYRSFPKSLKWFAFAFILLFVQSVLSTHYVYGQSFVEGMNASAGLFLCGMLFIPYYLVIRHGVSIDLVSRIIINLAWIYFFFLVYANAVGMSFNNVDEQEFSVMSMRKGLINLAVFIYIDRYFRVRHFKYFIFGIILFSANHLSDFQRNIFFDFSLTILFMLYAYRLRTSGILLTLGLLILVPVLSIFLQASSYGGTLEEKLGSVFELFEEEQSRYSDYSIGARVKEANYAIESIQKYPITGVGRISSKNVESYTGLGYFYVSDIGIIGLFFSFGILGMIIYLNQIRYWWRNQFKKHFKFGSELNGYIVFLLFSILYTTVTGSIVFNPAGFLIVIVFIEAGKHQMKTEHEEV